MKHDAACEARTVPGSRNDGYADCSCAERAYKRNPWTEEDEAWRSPITERRTA